MSFESLLVHSLTVYRTTAEARDAIGGVGIATQSSTVLAAYVYPVGGKEDERQRNTQMGEWRALVGPDADVDGWDRAAYDGRSFDIIAPPEPVWNPRTNVHHHTRIRLREVQ